jgi:hypothetical protein
MKRNLQLALLDVVMSFAVTTIVQSDMASPCLTNADFCNKDL